jgi:hypothetical protein
MQWAMAVTTAFVLIIGITYPVKAADFETDGYVGPDEVIDDDVFLEGQDVTMDGTINGNLIAGADIITINGVVNGDAILGGSTIIISDTAEINGNLFAVCAHTIVSGHVTGSIFGGSATLDIDAEEIGGNVYFGGYSFTLDQDSVVKHGVHVGSYQALIAGQTDEAYIGAAAIAIRGTINGNANIEVGYPGQSSFSFGYPTMDFELPAAMEPGLKISEDAFIGGELSYQSPSAQEDAILIEPEGGISFTQVSEEDLPDFEFVHTITEIQSGEFFSDWSQNTVVFHPAVSWTTRFLRNFVTLMILGGLALWLLSKPLKKSSETVQTQTWNSLGFGVLSILVFYVGAFIAVGLLLSLGIGTAVITLGKLSGVIFGLGFTSLAFLTAIFSVLMNYGSKLVIAFLIGKLFIKQVAPTAPSQNLWALLSGVFVYALLRSIPLVGWIFGLLATLFGLGAMWLAFSNWRNNRKGLTTAEAVNVESVNK